MDLIEHIFSEHISDSTFDIQQSNFKPKYWWCASLGIIFRRQLIAKRKLDKNPTPDNF